MEIRSNTTTSSRQPWHDAAYWGLLALACVAFLVMNVLTTLKEDDMGFTLIDGVWTPIRSLGDLLRSHCTHYVATNGRTSDLFALLFCSVLGKMTFNVCNTLVFGLLAHLISLLSTGRRSMLALTAFVACVGTCYPVPGETLLWLSGSCNYAWAITASLLLVYYLQRDRHAQPGWGRAVLLLLAGLLAGSMNEATSFGFLAGLCCYYLFNRDKFDRAARFALTGYVLGVLLIVASPAAWDRASNGGIITDLGLAHLLSSRWVIFSEKMWRFLTPVVALAVGAGALLVNGGRVVCRSVWTWILLSLALVMFALGIMHERAYAPIATVSLIIVVKGADGVLGRWPWARLAVMAVALGLGLFTWGRGIKVLADYRSFESQVVNEIVAAPRQAVLHERFFPTYSRFIKPLNYSSSNYFSQEVVYCGYFDKDNVQFVGDSVYVRYHEGRLLDGARPLPFSTDRPDVTGAVMAIKGRRGYMVVELDTDTLPCTFQMARYYMSQPGMGLTAQEAAQRDEYGLVTDYTPMGFYPISYQGKNLLIFDIPGPHIQRIVFPVTMGFDPVEVTLTRQQP